MPNPPKRLNKDDESGLEFAQARYYNTSHGRFTSTDPLTASANVKDPQTFNRYTYAMNSPYKFTDPLGLLSSSTGACGQWCGNGSYGGGLGIGLYSDNGQTIQIGHEQQASPPTPPPANDGKLLIEERSYSFTATRTGKGKFGDTITQVEVTVVESTFLLNENGDTQRVVTTSAKNGEKANNMLTDAQLDTVAEVVAETIAASYEKKFDRELALAMFEKETFFGILGSRSDKAYNPGQYTSGIGDGRTVAAENTEGALRKNIELTLDLYRQKENELKTTDSSKVLESYRGKGLEPNYNKEVLGNRDRIKNSIQTSEKVTHPFTFHSN